MAISVRSDQLSKQASKGGNETFHFIHILIYADKIDSGGLSPALDAKEEVQETHKWPVS